MSHVKNACKWCIDRFSLARLLMFIVLLILGFGTFAQIKSQQIGEEYKLKVMQPKDFKPVAPNGG